MFLPLMLSSTFALLTHPEVLGAGVKSVHIDLSRSTASRGDEVCLHVTVLGNETGQVHCEGIVTKYGGQIVHSWESPVDMVDGVGFPIERCGLPTDCPVRYAVDVNCWGVEANTAHYTVRADSCSAWRLKNLLDSPIGSASAVAIDRRRRVAVLHGGFVPVPPGVWIGMRGTWEWDGREWMYRTSDGPTRRGLHSMVYDSRRNVIVLFGGESSCAFLDCTPAGNGTWEWDGTSWELRAMFPLSETGSRYAPPRMAFDPIRGVTVMIAVRNGRTWEWNGREWRNTGHTLPHSNISGLAYDPVHQGIVGVGDFCSIWRWTVEGWQSEVTSDDCQPMNCHGLFLEDPSNDRVLLIQDPASNRGGRVWELQGSAWRLSDWIAPAHASFGWIMLMARGPRLGSTIFGGGGDRALGTWILEDAATDFDADGDFDLTDIADVYNCFGHVGPVGRCATLDLTSDWRVDLQDYNSCFPHMTGPRSVGK